MKTLISTISAVSALVLVVSCGGGGDAPASTPTTPTAPTTTTTSADVADKYVGTWGGCLLEGSVYQRESLAFSKQNATTVAFTFNGSQFAAADCNGAALATTADSGTVVFGGTKTIGTSTVDKGIVIRATTESKQVFLATATTLIFGRSARDGGPVDADGYPTTLDSGLPLTRQ